MSAERTYRCAIYTRKSTQDGLEQDFNSLDAQHEACAAYIASQKGCGWQVVAGRYDDGGHSGGTMDRPALARLITDIEARLVDVVVVYKIDRLTRSLMDFARMVDVFDRHGVSFVSVTQQFNTTTSMGRLTLNVLLSFAQFEREVTAERIRDKIAASKRKGLWTGGPPPLGYDVEDKALVVNEAEAETVRRLYRLYLEEKSVARLKRRADAEGIVTKLRRMKDRRSGSRTQGSEPHGSEILSGGRPFSRGNLYQLLANPLYIGKVVHRGQTHDGQHRAIVDDDLWDAVRALMSSNTTARKSPVNTRSPNILTGLLYEETGDRLSPTYTEKAGARYRYYISHRLMRKGGRSPDDGWRLPAAQIERPVLDTLCDHLADPLKVMDLIGQGLGPHEDACGQTDAVGNVSDMRDTAPNVSDMNVSDMNLSASRQKAACEAAGRLSQALATAAPQEQKDILASFVHRIDLDADTLTIAVDAMRLRERLGTVSLTGEPKAGTADKVSDLSAAGSTANDCTGDTGGDRQQHIRRIELAHTLRRRGVETKLVLTAPSQNAPAPDRHLIATVAKAHYWFRELTCGNVRSIDELATLHGEDRNEVSRLLPLAHLAPDIVEAILKGTQPVDLTLERLRRLLPLPASWKEQRHLLGFADRQS